MDHSPSPPLMAVQTCQKSWLEWLCRRQVGFLATIGCMPPKVYGWHWEAWSTRAPSSHCWQELGKYLVKISSLMLEASTGWNLYIMCSAEREDAKLKLILPFMYDAWCRIMIWIRTGFKAFLNRKRIKERALISIKSGSLFGGRYQPKLLWVTVEAKCCIHQWENYQ